MNLPVSNSLIDLAGLVLLGVVLVGLAVKASEGMFRRFPNWRLQPRANDGKPSGGGTVSGFFNVLFTQVFATSVLGTCDRAKQAAHLLIFWGFVFTGVSTVLAWATNPQNLVLDLTNPVKLFGNAGGVLILIGFAVMFYVRYNEKKGMWHVTRGDYFILALLLTVVTGFITQQAVYSYPTADMIAATFWVHMGLVVLLMATAPFTKFGHALFKPVWLLYDKVSDNRGEETLIPAPSKMNALEHKE